jgi:hypothetical protein
LLCIKGSKSFTWARQASHAKSFKQSQPAPIVASVAMAAATTIVYAEFSPELPDTRQARAVLDDMKRYQQKETMLTESP